MEFNTVVFVDQDEVVKAYEDGRCDVYTTDSSALAAERSKFANPADHIILPEIISKEPLGPVVRQGDDGWFNLCRWTYYALLEAEELGVTQANVDEMLGSDNPAIKRLLGVEGDFGTPMGLTKDWAYQIIKHIGNYAETYEQAVGPSTPIGLARGLNALWRDGGIQYAPPIRSSLREPARRLRPSSAGPIGFWPPNVSGGTGAFRASPGAEEDAD